MFRPSGSGSGSGAGPTEAESGVCSAEPAPEGAARGHAVLPLLAAMAVSLAACSGLKRPVPVSLLAPGGPAEPPAATVPDSVAVAWRIDVGASLLAPLIADGPVLLAGTGNGAVLALSTATGERFWKRGVAGAVAGGLVRDGDRLVLAAGGQDGRVYALRLRDGGRLWEWEVGATSHPPVLRGDTVFLAAGSGGVRALDARTGEELWRARVSGRPASPPVVHGPWVLVPTTADTLFRLERGTGAVAGAAPLPAGISAAPAQSGDRLYLPLHSGELVAYDLATHAELWRASLGAPILASPVIAADGTVYALTRSAVLWRIGMGGAAERLASPGGTARGSLALAGNRLLVGRLDGTLLALRHDGTVVWRERFGDSIAAPAAVSGGAVYVPLLRGTVVKLEGVR